MDRYTKGLLAVNGIPTGGLLLAIAYSQLYPPTTSMITKIAGSILIAVCLMYVIVKVLQRVAR